MKIVAEHITLFRTVTATVLTLSICCFAPNVVEAEQGAWDKAGQQVGEAAGAVADASVETWKKTKRAGSSAWEKTREVSDETWEKTKKTSGEVWEKTRKSGARAVDSSGDALGAAGDGASTLWEKTKKGTSEWFTRTQQKVHDLTGPEHEN